VDYALLAVRERMAGGRLMQAPEHQAGVRVRAVRALGDDRSSRPGRSSGCPGRGHRRRESAARAGTRRLPGTTAPGGEVAARIPGTADGVTDPDYL
jgi:hypothetical protein